MNAQQESNVVEVFLPYWDNVDKAVQIMQRFGDVGGVNVLNSQEGLLEIAYFDIRAAKRAVEAIKDCWLVAPCGNRRVRLPGSTSLDPSVVDKISLSEMYIDDPDRDYYTLVFYDVRDAAAYRETMVFEENGSAVDPIIESSEQLHNEWVEPGVPSPPADWSAAPAGVAHGRGLVAASGWWPGGPGWKKEDGIMSSIAEGDENSEMDTFQAIPGTYSILLQGIPMELLNKTCVDAILEQAGLANDVLNCTVKGRGIGLCVLVIMGQEGVCRCLNHFAGCRWGVRATLISGDTPATNSFPLAEEARRDGYDKADWTTSGYNPARDFWLADDKAVNAVLPRVPKTLTTEGMLTHVAKPTSEASTDVLSESDEENSKLQGRAQHLWYGSGAIM